MVRTQVYLTPGQKTRLEAAARDQGVPFAEIVRRAIDAYDPNGADIGEKLQLLDLASRRAEEDIRWMTERLRESNERSRRLFDEINQMRRARGLAEV